MRTRLNLGIGIAILLAAPNIAHAYVGPGLGAGALAVFLGLIASVFLALFAIIWYPVKGVVKRFRSEGDS